MMRKFLILVPFLVILTAGGALAQSGPRGVVNKFYSAWLETHKKPQADSDRIFASTRDLFDPAFYSVIKETMDIGKDHSEGIQGYDFDPFFSTQDAVFSFRLDSQKIRNGVASVPVYATGGRNNKPVGPERIVMTAQLRQIGGRWKIVDMIYPHAFTAENPNSLSQLSRQIIDEYRKRKRPK